MARVRYVNIQICTYFFTLFRVEKRVRNFLSTYVFSWWIQKDFSKKKKFRWQQIFLADLSGDLISYVPTSNIGQIMLGKLTELMSFLHDITQWLLLLYFVPKLYIIPFFLVTNKWNLVLLPQIFCIKLFAGT